MRRDSVYQGGASLFIFLEIVSYKVCFKLITFSTVHRVFRVRVTRLSVKFNLR